MNNINSNNQMNQVTVYNNEFGGEDGIKKTTIGDKKLNIGEEKTKKTKRILFFILGLIAITVLICIIIYLVRHFRKPPKPPETPEDPVETPKKPDVSTPPLEMQLEYKINTNVNDLKRIYINQRYTEDIKIGGVLTNSFVDRKTNYDIFIISETESDEETKQYYNKTYYCSISISSECISTQDDFCIPQKLVDLIDQDYSHVRVLEETETLEEFPLPLCFFNMTDNNVITSIACHKNISESRVNSIVLDLYFFRPPGIKRMENDVTITTRKENGKEIITEKNSGICEVQNSIGSICTTNMITTKDLKGNLLTYEEEAKTNIRSNGDNYYLKDKFTYLIDKSEYVAEINPQKYNETLNIIYPYLKDYLKNYEHFSLDDFKTLYDVSKDISKKDNRRLELNQTENNETMTFNFFEKLFNYSHYSGVQINLKIFDNVGYNSEAMKASAGLEIDKELNSIEEIKEPSDINKALNKLTSSTKAGNNLANKLYKSIIDKFNNITEIINIQIPIMINLVNFKDLTDIFDSTFSLNDLKIIPNEIVEESNQLINKLKQIQNEIDDGSLKRNISILNDYIYKFIKQSHILVYKIYENLKDLGELLKSPKQAIAAISTYYMNHTSTSYINTINEAKKILMNYYINEKDLIIPEVDKILEDFEKITIESLQKQIYLVSNLTEKFESSNLTIEDAIEEDYTKIINNLQNSNSYLNEIISLFKTKVRNEMPLKDGYFISKNDMESNNYTYNDIIEKSLSIAINLDNNEYVDKTFDTIMTDFRKDFTTIVKIMEEKKEEEFPMDEKTLNGNYFLPSDQNKMSEDLKKLGEDIINKIKRENTKYLNLIKQKVDEFLLYHKDNLNEIYYELTLLMSEVELTKIDTSYKEAFEGYLDKATNEIEINNNLTKEYFDELEGYMVNNDKIIDLLKVIPADEFPSEINYCIPEHCWGFTNYTDLIAKKFKTNNYISKYNTFYAKFDSYKDFIDGDLYIKILQEYKTMINRIKGSLQTFKNNSIINIYPELFNFTFVDEHIQKLDDFYYNLNKYISDERFNNYYSSKYKEYKNQKTSVINEIKSYIENKHNNIGINGTYNDYINDFCASYKRKRTFTCSNSAVRVYNDDGIYCSIIIHTDNYKNLISPKFDSNKDFQKKFEDYLFLINNKIESYNKIISDFKKNITDVESEILNEKITLNYLSPILNKTMSILSEKYSDNLIKGSYDYYKDILDKRLESVLNSASTKWINTFNALKKKVIDNKNNFKSEISEFGLVALIYNSIISQNLTNIYFDSIIDQQKNEMNYTISFYYNILLQNITSVYQTIFHQIPTNQEGFNNIIELRKKEIKEGFDDIIHIINNSKETALSPDYQTNSLLISPLNFFNMNSILTRIKTEIKESLNNIALEIYGIENEKPGDQFAYMCRFYLENSLNGWQIEDIYEPINSNEFIKLKLDIFTTILSGNWIFDQDNFINKLNISLYQINLEINNDFLNIREEYKKILEKKISDFYSKNKIIQNINDQYNNQIKQINDEMAINIIRYIQDILEAIKIHLIKEGKRIQNEAVSYSKDFTTINMTIKNIKDEIVNNLKGILHKIINDFNSNIINEAYQGRFESGLDQYYEAAENFALNSTTYNTLKSTFNIGDIIFEIVKGLVKEYKNFTLTQINLKNQEFIEKIENEARINEIIKLIDDELDPKFSDLLYSLKNIAVDNVGNDQYDLSIDIKNNISSILEEKIDKISNIVAGVKGNEYNKINLGNWTILDYQRMDEFEQIERSFEKFIVAKKEIENNQINTLLKEIIRDNFNTLINNLILSFGKEFFERILRYNENFKISTLYQDLKFTLVTSLSYYILIKDPSIDSLSLDLKLKLYKLNNLDEISKQKNQQILDSLNYNIDDFIEQSKLYIIDNYKSFLKGDALIRLNFGKNIIDKISINLEEISSVLENDYTILLNEEFKTKFINSYTKTMNEKTNDMIQTVEELKQTIKSEIDDIFSSDIDEILNKTNNKMNETLDSIKEYNTHFNSFKIPEQLINYLETYGDNVIQKAYDGIEALINKETKNITLNYLEKNENNFKKNLNIEQIIEIKNNTYNSIKYNLIDKILEKINEYGINEYLNNLNNEIDRIDSIILRRLNGEQTQEDIKEEFEEKVAENSVEEIFNGLLNESHNTLKEIQINEYFDKYKDLIQKYIKRQKISYKESYQIIYNAYRDEQIFEILNDKLETLYNLSINYYEDIDESISSLKSYIEDSLIEIYNLLNKCVNITYETFANKYEEISSQVDSIEENHDKTIDKKQPIEHKSISENYQINTNAKLSGIKKKAKFKFSLIYEQEGDFKRPRIEALVINNIRPDNVELRVSQPIGNCGEDFQKININFNDVSYSIKLQFDTKSSLINITQITDFDEYTYNVGRFLIEDSDQQKCINILGIITCKNTECNKNNPKTIDPQIEKKVRKKYKEITYLIKN